MPGRRAWPSRLLGPARTGPRDAETAVPDAPRLGQVSRLAAAVPADRDATPGRARCQILRLAEPGALESRPAMLARPGWGQGEQGGVGRQSRCPGRAGYQQRPAVVGRVADPMDWPAGELGGD